MRNHGAYPAHVRQFLVAVHGPHEENLDRFFAGDGDSPIALGGVRRLQRVCPAFGETPGTHILRVLVGTPRMSAISLFRSIITDLSERSSGFGSWNSA